MDFKKQLYKIIGIFIGLLAAVFIVFFFLQKDVEKNAGLVNQKVIDMKKKSSSLAVLAALQKDAETAKAYSAQLDKMLIGQDQILDFRKAIIDLGRSNNMDITVTFNKASKSGGLLMTPFVANINGKGGMEGVRNFLEAVEASPYFVKIQSVDFTQTESGVIGNFNGSVASF